MKITTVGLDLAKSVFHVVCFDAQHREIRKRMLRRGQVREFFSQMEPCVVVMEACAGAHYWRREIEKLGHKAKLIPLQFVKPYVQGNKNDYNDARAIAEASTRPKMRFVELKTVEQQDVQALHRLREQRVKERTALCNQLRALVAEYGLVMNKGVAAVRRGIPELLEDAENGLSEAFRALLKRGYDQLVELEKHIDYYTWADVGSPTFHVGERCLVPWWQGWASCVSPTYRNQRPALANENRTQDAVRHDSIVRVINTTTIALARGQQACANRAAEIISPPFRVPYAVPPIKWPLGIEFPNHNVSHSATLRSVIGLPGIQRSTIPKREKNKEGESP